MKTTHSGSQVRNALLAGALVLLMCSSSQALIYWGPFGGTGGGNYNDCVSSYLSAGPVTGISFAYGNYINRIAFLYGSTWSPFHGGNYENVGSIAVLLGTNEHIRGVRGTVYADIVTSLVFETTVRSISFGKASGSNFYASDSQGRYVRCAHGKSGELLDSIGFGFGFLSETTPTEGRSVEADFFPLALEVAPASNLTSN